MIDQEVERLSHAPSEMMDHHSLLPPSTSTISFMYSLKPSPLTGGNWPQQLKSLRLMTALAPSDITKSRLSSSDTTPMALAPETAQSCTAMAPRPPDAPHTSTLWPGRRMCGRWPNSIRYDVASTRV